MSAFFQGSYGVVKLAYNEDDNTYYVSPSSTTRVLVPEPELSYLRPGFQRRSSWGACCYGQQHRV